MSSTHGIKGQRKPLLDISYGSGGGVGTKIRLVEKFKQSEWRNLDVMPLRKI